MLGAAGIASCSSGPDKPDPPTGAKVTPAEGMPQEIAFTAPEADGGAEITGYNVACTSQEGGSGTATGKTSPISLSGLATGHTFTCTVAAENSEGASEPSAPSNAFTPLTVSTPPRPTAAVPFQTSSAKVVWDPPTNNGGTPVTEYTVTPFQDGEALTAQDQHYPASVRSGIVTGLRVGQMYSFKIQATNAMGNSAKSENTGQMTVGAPGRPSTPTISKTTPGAARVLFDAPANNGAAITNFAVVCSTPKGSTRGRNGPASPIAISGMTQGQNYTCTVLAQNSRGNGPTSKPSAAFRP